MIVSTTKGPLWTFRVEAFVETFDNEDCINVVTISKRTGTKKPYEDDGCIYLTRAEIAKLAKLFPEVKK